MSCCSSNILSSLILILFTVFSSASFYGFLFFHLQSIKRKDDPQEVKVQMQFMVYGTRPSKDKSGAYLFLPDGKAKVFSLSFSAAVCQMFTCLSEALIDSLLCIVSLYHAGVLGAGRQANWVLLHLFIDFFLTQHSAKDSLEHSWHLWLHLSLPSLFTSLAPDSTFLSSCFQPYNQKEPPVVRVVEGPLFSEVVAHYQHFQQTIRINNVPGNKLTVISVLKWLLQKKASHVWLKAPDGAVQKGPICLTKWQFIIWYSCLILTS